MVEGESRLEQRAGALTAASGIPRWRSVPVCSFCALQGSLSAVVLLPRYTVFSESLLSSHLSSDCAPVRNNTAVG